MELEPMHHRRPKKQRVAREREKGGNPERYYRKRYIEACGLKKLDSGFEIHHLDHNWKNDEIKNLVAIPSALHVQFHKLEKRRFIVYKNDQFFIQARFFLENSNLSKLVIQTYFELNAWISYRDFLIGNIGLNLYNLSYE